MLGAPLTNIFRLGCRLVQPPFDLPIEDHMRYVLLICDDEKGWAKLSEAERRHYMGEFGKLRQEVSGQYVSGAGFLADRR
jgi:hypothetical protein